MSRSIRGGIHGFRANGLQFSWYSDFRESRSLDGFDFSFNPGIPRDRVHQLATCRFIADARDVMLVGPPRVGKSHLAQALGREAILDRLLHRAEVIAINGRSHRLAEGGSNLATATESAKAGTGKPQVPGA